MTNSDDMWLQRWDPRHARMRLVCFPHAGGSAVFYRSWAQRFAKDVDVVAVQYPGRMNRFSEPCIDDVRPLADAICAAIVRSVPPPFALFGHSMGAMVAFETALRLERGPGPAAAHLFVSGRRGPRHHRPGRRYLASDESLLHYIRVLGGTDAAFFDEPHLRPVLLPMLRSDFKMSETWRPEPDDRVGCSITALVGDSDPEVPVEGAAGWRDATRADFDLRVFPGHHFYLLDREREVIDAVATICRRELARSRVGAATAGEAT